MGKVVHFDVANLGDSFYGTPQSVEMGWLVYNDQMTFSITGYDDKQEKATALFDTTPQQLSDLIVFLTKSLTVMVEQNHVR